MLDASGIWSVRYIATEGAKDENPEPDEIATIILGKDGTVNGTDPFGGKYTGNYSVKGDVLTASVVVDKSYDEAETIFQGLDYPLRIELSANYTSPDHFAANCTVNEFANLLVTCKRIGDFVC